MIYRLKAFALGWSESRLTLTTSSPQANGHEDHQWMTWYERGRYLAWKFGRKVP